MKMDMHSRLGRLIELTGTEAETLERHELCGDEFLRSVVTLLTSVSTQGRQLSNEETEKLRLLGRAAVRTYQSFDSIDSADRFVELACNVSKAIEDMLGDGSTGHV